MKTPENKKVNLVLSGTGAFYPVHAGAVCALMDLGYEFKAISATSGGSIIGIALASGASYNRLKRSIIDFNPWRVLFRNLRFPFTKGWGFYSSKPLEGIVKRFSRDMTFNEARIPLEIVTTQIMPRYKPFILNKNRTPNMNLSEAARISCTIPILFQTIELNNRTLIDGTFADNLHIKPFEDDFKNTIAIGVKVHSGSYPTNFFQYIKECLSMIITGQGSGPFIPSDLTYIPIKIKDHITPLKFSLSRLDRIKLFEIGYSTVIEYFTKEDIDEEEIVL